MRDAGVDHGEDHLFILALIIEHLTGDINHLDQDSLTLLRLPYLVKLHLYELLAGQWFNLKMLAYLLLQNSEDFAIKQLPLANNFFQRK